MVTFNEAIQLIRQRLSPLSIVEVSIADALGAVVASDVFSPMDVPSFDNSAMDGFAFQWQAHTSEFEIKGQIKAGVIEKNLHVAGNVTYQIFTGAAIPVGADTVVPVELTHRNGNTVSFETDTIQKGANVRLKGEQCRKGELILRKGATVSACAIALLASLGIKTIGIYKKPTISLVTTGNEVKDLGESLKPGELYNSNAFAIKALLKKHHFELASHFHVVDEYSELLEKINTSLSSSDVLLLTGGVSAGEYDFVRDILTQPPFEKLFYGVKQKPGKPLLVAQRNGKWVFALPGNPSSAISCFRLYVLPTINRLMGIENSFESDGILPISTKFNKKKGMVMFAKALVKNGHIEILEGQDSFNLLPFTKANAFVALDEAHEEIHEGAILPYYLI